MKSMVDLQADRSVMITQIAKAVDDETVSRDLVPAFVKLLKDTEAEVRTAIAGQIPGWDPLPLLFESSANFQKAFVGCWIERHSLMK